MPPLTPIADYLASHFAAEDAVLLALRDDCDRNGFPAGAIAPETGRLIQLMLRLVGARRVLEVGTLCGYSAIWIMRALPRDGTLLSIEREPERVAAARQWLAHAGFAGRAEVRLGAALDVLPALDGEGFDAVLLDADRESLTTYLDWSLRLVRPGGVIMACHTLAGGRVVMPMRDPRNDDTTRAVQEFNRRLSGDDRMLGMVIPIDDGLGVAFVK